MKLPGGIWPVMLTPFKENGALDLAGLERLTEFYIESGAAGLFANCLSSEMFELTPEERLSITSVVVKQCRGRIPVVSTGTFSNQLKENTAFIEKIHDLGVAAVVVNTNQLCEEGETEEFFKSRMDELLDATGDIPLGLYECPVPYKRLLKPCLLHELAITQRFTYFKDTSCNSDQILEKLEESSGTKLRLYNANTPTGLQSLRDGAAGLSPIGANYYPELYHYLYSQALSGNDESLRKVEQFLVITDMLIHTAYPHSAKYFLQKRGLPIATFSRSKAPLPAFDDRLSLKALLSASKELFDTLGINSVL